MRTVEIDFDNISDLKRWITKLQKRRKQLLGELGYQGVSFAGSKKNFDALAPLIDGILATDLSCIYGVGKDASSYVYFHCDPTKPLKVSADLKHFFLARLGLKFEPIYVGKGIGNRAYDLCRNDGHKKSRQALLKRSLDLVVVKATDGLSEAMALEMESKWIDILGLRALSPNGILVNLDEGALSMERRKLYGPAAAPLLKRNGFIV